MSNFLNKKPIIIQYQQNDASVETENYLRNKRFIIGNIQNLQQSIQEGYKTMETSSSEMTQKANTVKNRLNELLEKY